MLATFRNKRKPFKSIQNLDMKYAEKRKKKVYDINGVGFDWEIVRALKGSLQVSRQ